MGWKGSEPVRGELDETYKNDGEAFFYAGSGNDGASCVIFCLHRCAHQIRLSVGYRHWNRLRSFPNRRNYPLASYFINSHIVQGESSLDSAGKRVFGISVFFLLPEINCHDSGCQCRGACLHVPHVRCLVFLSAAQRTGQGNRGYSHRRGSNWHLYLDRSRFPIQ